MFNMSDEVNTVAKQTDDELKEAHIEKRKMVVSTVLKISDDDSDKLYFEGSPKYFYRNHFKDYYLRKLILQDVPPSIKKDCYLMKEFGLSIYESKEENTNFFRFYCHPDEINNPSTRGYDIISGPTISGERIMKKMRQSFNKQTWTNDNTFQVPFKSKMNKEVARKIVSKCVDDEYQALFNFIVFLQKQHEQKK